VPAEMLSHVLNVTAGTTTKSKVLLKENVGFACNSDYINEQHESVLWNSDGSSLIVADFRLFNIVEIATRLGIGQYEDSNFSLYVLLRAYECWGEGMLDYLDGEYAFAIWDTRQKRLFAARDPFGIKPLFYFSDSKRFVFGSEPKQILILPGVPIEPDHIVIGEFLFNNFEDLGRTFFAGVRRLKPGHYLTGSIGSVQQSRYWDPNPDQQLYLNNPSRYIEQFRTLFNRAVEKRLRSKYAIAAQLSGGMDSTSVVSAAANAYREKSKNQASFETISAAFPDMECDESSYIDAICKCIPFANHRLFPIDEPILGDLDSEFWWIDSPMVDLQRGLFKACINVLSDSNARLLLTGIGGDELVHEEYYLRDIAKSHRYFRLIKECLLSSRNSWNSIWYLLSDALRASIPTGLKSQYREFNPPKQWMPPVWANSEFVREYGTFPKVEAYPDQEYPSLTQALIVRSVTHPHLCWGLEGVRARYAHHGVDVSHPFLDRELVEFVLQIPFDMRMPGGQWKYLLKSAFKKELPPEILNRRKKTRFDSFNQVVLKKNWKDLERILFSNCEWESGYFVSCELARQQFQSFSGERLKDINFVADTWKITCLELWMRQLPRYTKLSK